MYKMAGNALSKVSPCNILGTCFIDYLPKVGRVGRGEGSQETIVFILYSRYRFPPRMK
jgi:hypothetical protein